MRARIVTAVATMLASASGAGFDDPAMVATIALGALVGPVQALLEGQAPAAFRARAEGELVLLVTAYLLAHQPGPMNLRERTATTD